MMCSMCIQEGYGCQSSALPPWHRGGHRGPYLLSLCTIPLAPTPQRAQCNILSTSMPPEARDMAAFLRRDWPSFFGVTYSRASKPGVAVFFELCELQPPVPGNNRHSDGPTAAHLDSELTRIIVGGQSIGGTSAQTEGIRSSARGLAPAGPGACPWAFFPARARCYLESVRPAAALIASSKPRT